MNPSLINSVIFSGNDATVNITPPVDGSYAFTQLLYKKFGSSSFTVGETYVGVGGVAGDVVQSGLESGVFYEFIALASDGSMYSLPSQLVCRSSSEYVSEDYLFLDNLKTLVANCETFQDWINTNDVEVAKGKILFEEMDDIYYPEELPYILIYYDDGLPSQKIDTDGFITTASLTMAIVREISSEVDRDGSAIVMNELNDLGRLRNELLDKEGVSGFLSISSIQLSKKPQLAEIELKNSEGKCIAVTEYTIEVGV